MKRISGYVLAKETNSGISNLIVAAYDSEKSIRDTVSGNRMQEALSLTDLGKRIGSVLTDQTGRFVLESEDLEYQGNQSRPDLLIVISAPEDVQDVKTPYPLPPEERILYISTVPREDAGAEEAFVIRLLKEQLDHFHIPANLSTQASNTNDNRLATSVEAAWDFQDRLRDRFKPRLLEEQKRSDGFRSKAEQKVRNLSAIPAYLRNDDLTNNSLLINGKRDLAHNLKPRQDQVVENGLKRLKTRDAVVRLRLTETELEELGLRVSEGKVVGDLDPDKLAEKLRLRLNGSDLVRKRGLNNPPPEALIKRYFLDAPAQVSRRAGRNGE
jgi:hypothetical protein